MMSVSWTNKYNQGFSISSIQNITPGRLVRSLSLYSNADFLQFLFWIEGAGTVIFATFAWFWLPRTPATWPLLTPREKEIARSRILADSSVVIDEKVDIADAFRPFKSVLYWVWILISEFGVLSLPQNLILDI
jgi:hypothetical protein